MTLLIGISFCYMMRRMGFSEKWIKWIKEGLISLSISILVNGSPIEEFSMHKGLRQGDPLATFLFLLVAKRISGLMRQASKSKNFQGLVVGKDKVEVSVLQFADDILFFGEVSPNNVMCIKAILVCFELAFGLKVNFFKSNLVGLGVDDLTLSKFVDILNYHCTKIPFVYLGIPIGANPKKETMWESVMYKIKSKLVIWKQKKLSFEGSVTLINSVFSSLPLLFASLFKFHHVFLSRS